MRCVVGGEGLLQAENPFPYAGVKINSAKTTPDKWPRLEVYVPVKRQGSAPAQGQQLQLKHLMQHLCGANVVALLPGKVEKGHSILHPELQKMNAEVVVVALFDIPKGVHVVTCRRAVFTAAHVFPEFFLRDTNLWS